MKKMMMFAVLLLPLLSACGERNDVVNNAEAMPEEKPVREVDFAQVARGAKLYQMNCAECHGSEAQGHPDWRQRDADGMFPPPPLNGTGHAWHHPKPVLHDVIANGSPGGQGRMPAWRGKLDDEEIDAIIAWFQSKWPDQVYAAWARMNRARQGGG